MSTADLPPVQPGLPHGAGATPALGTRHGVVEAQRWATARRWAVSLLALATVALVGYLALLLLGAWMFAQAVAVVRPGDYTVDVAGMAADVLPSLLVGWCTGLATTAVIARGEALTARTTGVTGALLGTIAGALVLRLAGLW